MTLDLKARIQQREKQLNDLVSLANRIDTQRRDLDIKKDELFRQIVATNGAIQELKEIIKDDNDKKDEKEPKLPEVVPPSNEGRAPYKE